MYDVGVNPLARKVLGSIVRHEMLQAGNRVGVAVSGGIDSVALLRLLLELRGELGIVLSVVHFNHKLRGAESDEDEKFVRRLAGEFDLEFYCDSDDVAGHAREEGVSLETAARELRYGFFRHLIREGPQGLKPASEAGLGGTAEAVPLHEPSSLRSAGSESETALLRSAAPVAEGGREVKVPTLSQSARQGWGTPASSPSPSPSSFPTSSAVSSLASSHASLDKIATGHTLDDQAETVVMRLIRGAGLKGIGGIYPRIAVEGDDGEFCGEIVRPLLAFRRCELETYLKEIGQSWREDASNSEDKFTRNRVRKLVLPLLEKEFNPGVAENLAELAEIARGEEDYWENEVAGWIGTGVHWTEPEWARRESSTGLVQILTAGIPTLAAQNAARMGHPAPGLVQSMTSGIPILAAQDAARMGHPAVDSADSRLRARIESATWLVMNASVDRVWILGEPIAVQRRVVKAIGEQAGIPLEFKHVEEVLRFAAEAAGSGKELALPLGWKVERHPEELVFVTPDLRDVPPPGDYEFVVTIPGEVRVDEAGSIIEIRRVPSGMEAGYNPDHLFDGESLPGPLTVRNWRAGDRFWPRHTKAPKKVKELLQERHVEAAQRKLWPVIVSGDEIAWMRGFPPPARFAARPGHEAVVIVESPLDAASGAHSTSATTRGGHEQE